MKLIWIILILSCAVLQSHAQEKADGPSNEKAQKTYKEGLAFLDKQMIDVALGCFKKADKQDDGHCLVCQNQMIKYGSELHDWKVAETAAEEIVSESQGDTNLARAHYRLGVVYLQEGLDKRKEASFSRAHDEMVKALAAYARYPDATFADGLILGHLNQDEAAKARFEEFVKLKSGDDLDERRALRYISRPELARARMAPPFSVMTLDGQHISLDDLRGKVVLIDFWATWCGPCREALPHMKDIARHFQGQPLVILSVSLDTDDAKWKQFIASNGMTWLQTRDGGFTGPISRLFGVEAIPHTFTIDADSVLQDEQIGDASIEGKLKKLVSRAKELDAAKAGN